MFNINNLHLVSLFDFHHAVPLNPSDDLLSLMTDVVLFTGKKQEFCLPHEQYAIFLLVYMKLFCKHKVLLCNIEQEYTVVAELFIIC